jgi:phosphoglycolate phosphatase-like HAD superfamily hydrolase/ADP-ribose pyrophosphatase YjhB (NUDIX family)
MISSLILDWAGTLCDDVAITLAATNATLARFGGAPVDLDTYRREFTIPVEGFYAARIGGSVPMAAVDREFFAHYAERIADLELFDGAAALLHVAKQRGLGLFALTTVPEWIIEKALARFGLAGLFTQMYGSAFDKRRVLPQILSDHGLVRDEVLFIGDSTHDVEAAKLAHVRSGAALYGYSPEAKLRAASPDDLFASVADILRALDREHLLHTQKVVIATVGGFIEDRDGRILLVRTRKWSNTFGIPGGKIDYGETMLAAYEREMLEETGLRVTDTRFLMIQDSIESKEFIAPRHFLLINYVSRCANPHELRRNYELEEMRWATLDEAAAMNLNSPTRVALEHGRRAGIFGSEK